jgi:3-oxoacyl-[acyl-carrier-protein] synthase-3
MTPDERIAILGRGYALGSEIRGNDDPIFQYLIANPPPDRDLFEGLKYRRALGDGQSSVTLAVEAAGAALDAAALSATDVDMILGSVSAGEYYAPSALAAVHAELKLPDRCRVIALNTAYTAFLDGLKLAHDLIGSGSIGSALVVDSVDWTLHMDYHEAVSAASSDAAGAAVVGRTTDTTCFALVDWDNETNSQLYGALRMAPRPVAPVPPTYTGPQNLFTTPLMQLDVSRGAAAVRAFGFSVPPMVVNRLLARHGLTGQDITLVAHQTSGLIYTEWNTRIRPARYISTVTDLADMVSASVPVNLAKCYEEIETDHLILLGTGMEMHATALLYSRNGRASLTR